MGADIFESYVGSVIATIAIAATSTALAGNVANAIALPIVTVMVGLLASVVGIGMMKVLERTDPAAALRNVTFIAAVLFLAMMYFVVGSMDFSMVVDGRTYPALGPWFAIVAGTLVGTAIGLVTEYYTSAGPGRKIAKASETGTATNLITGLAVGIGLDPCDVVTHGPDFPAIHFGWRNEHGHIRFAASAGECSS